jgi:hypothetical protein
MRGSPGPRLSCASSKTGRLFIASWRHSGLSFFRESFPEIHRGMMARFGMPVKKLTPVLFAEKIESVLSFWAQHLAFIKAVEVPVDDRLAFVALQQGNPEIGYQSFASADTRMCPQLPPTFTRTNISLR